MEETIRQLKYATERHFEGDPAAINAATEAGLSIIKSGCTDHHAIRLACQAIAIDGMDGVTCPLRVLVPCLTNKVIRSQRGHGRISHEVAYKALLPLPKCTNTSCRNHDRARVETPTEEELAERGVLASHSDCFPWE